MPHEATPAPVPGQFRASEEIILNLVHGGELNIDSQGRVWRVGFHRRGRSYPCAPRRAEHRTPLGYLQVRSLIGGRRHYVGAHRLVWWFFGGPIPPGMVINHLNGRKDDNRPQNLECVTPSENATHAHRTGLRDQRGQRNPAAKLTDRQVAEIRLAYASGGIEQGRLATEYGVSFQAISKIVRGERRASQCGPVDCSDHRAISAKRDPITGRFMGGNQDGDEN